MWRMCDKWPTQESLMNYQKTEISYVENTQNIQSGCDVALRQKRMTKLLMFWCLAGVLFKTPLKSISGFRRIDKTCITSWFYYIFFYYEDSSQTIRYFSPQKSKKEESLSFSKVFNGLVGIGFGSIKSKNGQQPYETKPTSTFRMKGK